MTYIFRHLQHQIEKTIVRNKRNRIFISQLERGLKKTKGPLLVLLHTVEKRGLEPFNNLSNIPLPEAACEAVFG